MAFGMTRRIEVAGFGPHQNQRGVKLRYFKTSSCRVPEMVCSTQYCHFVVLHLVRAFTSFLEPQSPINPDRSLASGP